MMRRSMEMVYEVVAALVWLLRGLLLHLKI